jgi:prepilin-type N-terminal cleavage/methylation domain-containing protein
MTMTDRRGFTMVELMVALVLTLAVGGVTYGLLVTSQRVSRSQTEHVGMQDNVRSGALIVANELREVGYDSVPPPAALLGVLGSVVASPDLLVMEAGKIHYRAMRGTGFTCFPPADNQLRLEAATAYYLGVRPPQIDDSLTIYVENKNTTSTDDAWVHAKITGNVTTANTCSDGTAAYILPIAYEPGTVAGPVTAGMIQGGPVRVFEAMEMRHYQSGTQWWLGMRSLNTVGSVIQPVLGPLADSTGVAQSGLVFRYLDRDRNQTAVRANVREIQMTLKGVSDGAVRTTGGASSLMVDTLALTTNVALRNALRP